jgi:sigma-54 dependent transcriptional regulator, flagellar regulatory protein
MTIHLLPTANKAQCRANPRADAIDSLLVGGSAPMAALRHLIRLIGASDAPVLLHGPTGSGKEVAARAVHAASGDGERPFIAVNCGAIPADLIESELFGHEKGSFTGASERRIGRFEAANGGTLFLDEIGDMPLAAQVRLLRILEERSFERVGSTKPIAFTGRIVCASHRDLSEEIRAGRFREDLWYRLAVLPIAIPALADRREDIAALVTALSGTIAGAPGFGTDAIALLQGHDWPGNVRELRNLLARAAILYRDGTIGAAEAAALLSPLARSVPHDPVIDSVDPDLRNLLDKVERTQLKAALDRTGGVVSDAARLVNLNRTTFIDRMRRHGLSRDAVASASA